MGNEETLKQRTYHRRITYECDKDTGIYKINGVTYISKRAFEKGLITVDKEE